MLRLRLAVTVTVSVSLVLMLVAPAAAQIYETVGTRAQGMGGAFVAVAFAFVGTWILGTAIKVTMGLRAPHEQEIEGLDSAAHGEQAYHLDLR
jgi:Amt family ammonium transporter